MLTVGSVGSGMFIPDPGSWNLSIPDPGSKNSNKRENLLSYLFCSTKYHKIETYFIFELAKKKTGANLPRIIELFTPEIVIKLSSSETRGQ